MPGLWRAADQMGGTTCWAKPASHPSAECHSKADHRVAPPRASLAPQHIAPYHLCACVCLCVCVQTFIDAFVFPSTSQRTVTPQGGLRGPCGRDGCLCHSAHNHCLSAGSLHLQSIRARPPLTSDRASHLFSHTNHARQPLTLNSHTDMPFRSSVTYLHDTNLTCMRY